MSCCPFDLRDYFLEELEGGERSQVEAHLRECAACREELERLRLAKQALLRLKEEEIPRRIAFVSDKIFEPSVAARWWAAMWPGVPRFTLAAAALSAVLFLGAWISRPSLTVESGRWQLAFGRSDDRVAEALASVEARHTADMRNIEQTYELLMKHMNILYRQSAEVRPAAIRQ